MGHYAVPFHLAMLKYHTCIGRNGQKLPGCEACKAGVPLPISLPMKKEKKRQ